MIKMLGRTRELSVHLASLRRFGLMRWAIVLAIIAIAALSLGRYISISLISAWRWFHLNRDDVVPLGTLSGAAAVAWAALRQAKTSSMRHEEQTEADRQRRITESFSKATEQMGNDKLPVRVGGVYTMERISRESPEDYWPAMETLTAFARENARWKDPDTDTSDAADGYCLTQSRQPGESGIPIDIGAVLAVICRREKGNYERERRMGWRFDLRGIQLARAQLSGAHLEGIDLRSAHLEGANLSYACLDNADLRSAHLEGVNLSYAHLNGARLRNAHLKCAFLANAHLEGADLAGAHLEGASLAGAHLEGAVLASANLEGASLWGVFAQRALVQNAHLGGASLVGAHFEGANLLHVTGVSNQIAEVHGDAKTTLPDDVERPAHWPSISLS